MNKCPHVVCFYINYLSILPLYLSGIVVIEACLYTASFGGFESAKYYMYGTF